MITPKLEELILCGKAFFKTAVVGGQKSTINIDTDRFIIITDITYLPYLNTSGGNLYESINTQISIYGERGFNHYIFRNKQPNVYPYWDALIPDVQPYNGQAMVQPQTINTYLLHTTQVGFSFITNGLGGIVNTRNGVADTNNPAFEIPLDYGKDGLTGSLPVDNELEIIPGFVNQILNTNTGLGTNATTQQIQYPADAQTTPLVINNDYFPIANINYVEILGQPNNIGI